MTDRSTQPTTRYHYHGVPVSNAAVEAVLQDIRDGVTYPDFWTNRYGEQDEQTSECQCPCEVEETAQA